MNGLDGTYGDSGPAGQNGAGMLFLLLKCRLVRYTFSVNRDPIFKRIINRNLFADYILSTRDCQWLFVLVTAPKSRKSYPLGIICLSLVSSSNYAFRYCETENLPVFIVVDVNLHKLLQHFSQP